ncbi:MAG: carboxymuconolactone decarboxylase family protein [candidate division KSB1 bacterium]|nr:carboxymuconolactone decarboxylase family protein [candidate division KSB1 bacterium]
MAKSPQEFQEYRRRMNERILSVDNLSIRRFFNLDGAVYKDGALDAKVKEMLGLVASMVLRCNDCIAYHLIQCCEAGATDEELFECFSIALIVGGSIVIPHLRYAVEFLDQLRQQPS